MDRQNSLVANILQAYGINYSHIFRVQKGYRNRSYPVSTYDGRQLNLIIYKREAGMLARIRRADAVANYLHRAGFAVRHSADDRIIALHDHTSQTVVRYAALYEYLPGETIPWEAYTMRHIKLLGQTLGEMHRILDGFALNNPVELPDVRDECAELVAAMATYFKHAGVREALKSKLALSLDAAYFDTAGKVLAASRILEGNQVLHMDFVRSNILFAIRNVSNEPVEISGILDFEKTAHGPAVFDVARSLAFLLVDCKYKPVDKVRRYFVQSGYYKRGQARLGDGQQALLNHLVRLYLVHDLYKFLRHNPYEYLPQNEHFVRTRNMLLKDGIIKPID